MTIEIYALKGFWDDDPVFVRRPSEEGVDIRVLALRLDELNRSPTGFAWGYEGAGPAQLAYCILREVGYSQEEARNLMMGLQRKVISQWSQKAGFSITDDQVHAVVEAIYRERAE